MRVVNTIKTALEREAALLHSENNDTARMRLTQKLEGLCRVLHVSQQDKAKLLAHIETLLAQTAKG